MIDPDSGHWALLRDGQGPEGWKGSSHGSTYPRGIIPSDLHPLEVGHSLVLGAGEGGLGDSRAGYCPRGHGWCQHSRLHADQLLPAAEKGSGEQPRSMVTHGCRARDTSHSRVPAVHIRIRSPVISEHLKQDLPEVLATARKIGSLKRRGRCGNPGHLEYFSVCSENVASFQSLPPQQLCGHCCADAPGMAQGCQWKQLERKSWST